MVFPHRSLMFIIKGPPVPLVITHLPALHCLYSLLSFTAIWVNWEHIQIKVIDVTGSVAIQSWGGSFSQRAATWMSFVVIL